MSESNQHSEPPPSALEVRAMLWRIRHEDGAATDEEMDGAIAKLDALVHQMADLIQKNGNLEEQYEDLKRQYDGISRESDERGIRMSDLHIENLRLKEQQETLLDLLRVSVGFWIATPQEFIDAQHNVPNRDKVKQIRDLLSNPSSEQSDA